MSDTLFGAIILIIFLVFVFALGFFIYRLKNWRLTNAWGPLVALVNGRVTGDGGGGATSWLSGAYEGQPVVASMSPGVSQHSGSEGGAKYNHFELALREIPGRASWSVDYARAILGMGRAGWQVKSKDPALQAALDASPLVSLAAALGEPPSFFMQPMLEYDHRERALRYRADMTPQWVPTPQQFAAWVEQLRQVAQINAQFNQPAA